MVMKYVVPIFLAVLIGTCLAIQPISTRLWQDLQEACAMQRSAAYLCLFLSYFVFVF